MDPSVVSAGTYTLDSRHVTLMARVRHLSLGYTAVFFDRINGSLTWDPTDITQSEMSLEIDTKMVHTNVPDGLEGGTFAHQIAGPQFLDGYTHPTATFVSKNITQKDDTRFSVEGDFTLLGVTQPLVLETEFLGARGGEASRLAFTATTTINRREFGITAFPDAAVGDNVLMHIDVEFCAGEGGQCL